MPEDQNTGASAPLPPAAELPTNFTAEFTYKIYGARTATVGDKSNVVKQVEWELTGTKDGQSFSLPQTTMLPDPNGQAFIPFEQLSQADIIGWLEASEPRLLSIKNHIQSVVDKMVEKAALTETRLPWLPPAEEVAPPSPAANPQV
jgi:hypothetical protein